MSIDAIALRRESRREFDLKPMFGGRVRPSAKQLPAQFNVRHRECSPLMGRLQRSKVEASCAE
jgi:hypothetical protein